VRQTIAQRVPPSSKQPRAVISRRWRAYLYGAVIATVLGVVIDALALVLLLIVLLIFGYAIHSVIRYGQTFFAGGVIHGWAAQIVGVLYVILSAIMLGVGETLLSGMLA
jgi:hypothetical protein